MMKKPLLHIAGISALSTVLSGCFIQAIPAPGGIVATLSGSVPACAEGDTCVVADMNDGTFDEIFAAVPAAGYSFLHWKKAQNHMFGCGTDPVQRVVSSFFVGNEFLEPFLSADFTMFAAPVFRSSGPEILYTTDFECIDIADPVLGDGWASFVNIFEANGVGYVGGYSVGGGAPNGAQISALTTGQGGAEQFKKQINVFSNYDSDFGGIVQHADGQLVEVNVFQEYTLVAGSEGTYTFTFDAKLPPTGAVASPSTANAFVKVLNPAAGFLTVSGTLDSFDSTTLTTDWSTQSVSVVITPGMAATLPTQLLLQFGFQNTSTLYNDSGVIYDNVVFRKTAP